MYPYTNQFNRFSTQNKSKNIGRRNAFMANSTVSHQNISNQPSPQKRPSARPFTEFFNFSGQNQIHTAEYSNSQISPDNEKITGPDYQNQDMNSDFEENDSDKDVCDEVNTYILKMLIEAIKDEIKDAHYYDEIAKTLTDEDDSKIFHKMHHDEDKHRKIFSEIFEMLTGEEPSLEEIQPDYKQVSENMPENFAQSIFDELSAVEFYRKLYFAFLNTEIRDSLFEIITDEQGHAQILNYMYSKYTNPSNYSN